VLFRRFPEDHSNTAWIILPSLSSRLL